MKKHLKNRFFFRNSEDSCYKIENHLDYMRFYELDKLELWLAVREVKSPYFYCRHYGEVGDKTEGNCGKVCVGYAPRNGISGVCTHHGYTYSENTEQSYTLTRDGKLHETQKQP